jgi:hypothetical protein
MNKLYLSILFWCICLLTHAQTLSTHRNYFRSGDVIIKQQVEFKDPGAYGKNQVWDFSRLNTHNDKYQLVYLDSLENDTTHIIGIEHETFYYYGLKRDTLWLNGYVNRTSNMEYYQPEAILRFPFRYGDTLRTTFAGKGYYCQSLDIVSKGYSKVCADALGKLITPDNDTLKNVLRLKRVKEFTGIGIDNAAMRMETYQWYARGSRYPVFESIKTFTLRNDSVLENFSTSFYFSTVSREQLQEDLANANLIDDTATPDEVLINCKTYPNPVATDFTVDYDLSVNAQVSFLLCDISGRPWANIPNKNLKAGVQQQLISMSGLHSGNYGLYIKVNDKVYKRTIIKK